MPSRNVKPVVLSSVVLLLVGLAAGEERLLSRNATYRLAGGGYCYPGQVQPGVNQRAKKGEFVYTPLVERTDTGDKLIDGKTDDRSIVSTPWYWSSQWKRITVEMKLPGQSKITRVRAHLPKAVDLRPESAVLFVKTDAGKWRKAATQRAYGVTTPREKRATVLTFELDQIACGELKLEFHSTLARVGVNEIEVWGDGPTESKTRGLLRSKPHAETLAAPKVTTAPGSVLLSKSDDTVVKLSGDALTAGVGGTLIDGDRTTPLRVDKKPHSHFSLTVELDLRKACLVEAVHVWMPGGKGSQTGHVHDLTVAIGSGSGEGAIWRTPVDLAVNPYWPGDDAPRPYAIPIGNLNVVGSRVRVTATLMGTGGVTNRLAMTEIEAWGRAADGAASPAAGLHKRPIRFDPEPVGKLHPKLESLIAKKVRAAWIGDNLSDKFAGTDKTKARVLVDAGFNLVRVSMGPDRKDRNVSAALEKDLPGNVREARRVGIALLIGWQYGSTHQEPYRKYRAPSGRLNERTCCPLDETYIERHIGRWAVAIARGGADGMAIDTEMYESDQTNYPGACVCDECFTTYLGVFSQNGKTLYDEVPAERRGLWLSANEATQHYSRFQAKRIEDQYDKIRARCQAINPAFLFAHAPFLEHVAGIERGLGTSSIPCLVLSEREYGSGPSQKSFANVERIRKEGIPALYLCGLFLIQQTPEMVEKNALIGSLRCDGWWLYYATAVLTHPRADDPKAFHRSYGRVNGTSARDYLDRITAMHNRLDGLLRKPKDQWPTPEK